jgi:tetratricopeptide (TPR) repeat protein
MQKATKSSFFFTDCFSLNVLADLQTASRQAEFYQQIAKELIKGVYTKQTFNSLGDRLIALAEHACYIRRFDVVEQVSQFLLNWPSREYKNLSLYYRALCLSQRKQFTESRALLERLTGELPPKFRAKALLAMAATCYGSGDFQLALPISIEAGRAAAYHDWHDAHAFITSQRNIAVHKSLDGDHRGALADLERLFPLARTVGRWNPYVYYEHLNSLAVELTEVGRLEEAQNASRIALASPYASAYPEWRETLDDIQLKSYRTSRSVLSLNHSALNINNVVLLPERNLDAGSDKSYRSPFQQQASVTSLQDWKQKMGKEPNGDKKNDQKEELSDRQMVMKIMEYATELDLPDEVLQQMLDAVKQIVEDYRKKKS